jgi:hypothetical protein
LFPQQIPSMRCCGKIKKFTRALPTDHTPRLTRAAARRRHSLTKNAKFRDRPADVNRTNEPKEKYADPSASNHVANGAVDRTNERTEKYGKPSASNLVVSNDAEYSTDYSVGVCLGLRRGWAKRAIELCHQTPQEAGIAERGRHAIAPAAAGASSRPKTLMGKSSSAANFSIGPARRPASTGLRPRRLVSTATRCPV